MKKCILCGKNLTISTTDDNSNTIIFCENNGVIVHFTEDFKIRFVQTELEANCFFDDVLNALIKEKH